MHCFEPKQIVNPRYSKRYDPARKHLDLWRGINGDPRGYPEDYYIIVPCGRCLGCFRDKAREWRVRLLHEHEYGNHTSCICLTLTISNEYINQFSDEKSFYKHFRDFLDRLRYYLIPRRSPKRFFVSELGDKTDRLHFHGFIWDCPELTDDIIARCWRYGFVCVRPLVSTKQLSYATKYITKCKKDFRPTVMVSPGLGEGYTEVDKWRNWHNSGDGNNPINLYCYFDRFVYSMPRYYRTKIFSPDKISDFKVSLSQNERPLKKFLGRTRYDEPRNYVRARARLQEVSLRSGQSIERPPRPLSQLCDLFNPYIDDHPFFDLKIVDFPKL